jgi:hypothetical protein
MSKEQEENKQLKVVMGIDKETNNIVIGFNHEVSWLSMTPEETLEFANKLRDRANDILNVQNSKIEIS